MKTMIRSILSRLLKSNFPSLIHIILLLFGLNVKAETEKLSEESKKYVLNSIFYSKQNTPFLFSYTTNYFIVLKNNKNCQSCFTIVNDFIKTGKASLHASFISITLIDSTTLNRKIQEAANKRLMPEMDGLFFQYKDNGNNLFNRLEINNTPEILIISNGEVFHASYSDIFEYDTMDIQYKLQQEIFRLLK
jgi:hypothetical protein